MFDGIPTGLPALLLAAKLQRKAHALGMGDPTTDEKHHALAQTLAALAVGIRAREAIGRVLLATVALSTELGIDSGGGPPRGGAP